MSSLPALSFNIQTPHKAPLSPLTSQQLDAFAEKVATRERFNAFECSLIIKLLNQGDNQSQVKEWLLLLKDGKRAQVIKEVQHFINKKIAFKDISKMLFYSTVQKLKKMSAPQKAFFITKKVLIVPLAPLMILYQSLKSVSTSKRRKSVKAAIKSAVSLKTLKSYRVRNKMLKATMKVTSSLLVSTAIATNALSLGVTAPLTIGLATAFATTTFSKIAHDLAFKKHTATIFAETLGASLHAAAIGALDVGVGSLFELGDILLELIGTSINDLKDPIGALQNEVEADANLSSDTSEAIRCSADNFIDLHAEVVTEIEEVLPPQEEHLSAPDIDRRLMDLYKKGFSLSAVSSSKEAFISSFV